MKKLLIGLIIIAALAVYLFKTQPNTAAVEQNNVAASNVTEPNLVNKKLKAVINTFNKYLLPLSLIFHNSHINLYKLLREIGNDGQNANF